MPPPHYIPLGPSEEDQVLTFALITFKMAKDIEHIPKLQLTDVSGMDKVMAL